MTDEFVQVGTWLLPETYGPDYDHFTQTRCETKPGVCIAVYAKRADVQGMPADDPRPRRRLWWLRFCCCGSNIYYGREHDERCGRHGYRQS